MSDKSLFSARRSSPTASPVNSGSNGLAKRASNNDMKAPVVTTVTIEAHDGRMSFVSKRCLYPQDLRLIANAYGYNDYKLYHVLFNGSKGQAYYPGMGPVKHGVYRMVPSSWR